MEIKALWLRKYDFSLRLGAQRQLSHYMLRASGYRHVLRADGMLVLFGFHHTAAKEPLQNNHPVKPTDGFLRNA